MFARSYSVSVVALILFLTVRTPLRASAEDLDPSFGYGGVVTSDFGVGADAAEAVALLHDGRILVVGYAEGLRDSDLLVACYRSTGELDRSFGVGGVIRADFGGSERGHGVTVASDGEITVVGSIAGATHSAS